MGEVYRATDTKLKRQVAIKILPLSLAADADRLARFQREAEVLAALNHPNIAAIYGLEHQERLRPRRAEDEQIRGELPASARAGGGAPPPVEEVGPFLVMELVEGEDLSQRFARGPIPLDEALPIARQIVDALEAAHELNIVHRDLKPANIKVRADGMVKVLDFGLAKAMEPVGAMSAMSPSISMAATLTTPAMMTGAGMILGTAAYMAPEQARGKPVDRRADIWAFGVVLVEMLTGERLFTGETISDTLASVLKTDPDWSALPAATPAAVRRLLRRCLEKDPRQRLQAIGEARILFSGPLEEEERAALEAAVPAPQPPVQPLVLKMVPWALTGLFLLTTAGVAWRHFRETPLPLKSIRFQVSAPEGSAVSQFRLSPDGRHLVFLATSAGQARLWVRPLDSVTATALAGTDGATYPFWSPDSTEIGFFAQGKLKKIPAAGGLAVPLCDVVNARGGTWNRDGVILFAPDVFAGLYRVADTGGSPVAVTTISAPIGDRFPEFLPDGQKFLFLRNADKGAGIYAGSLSDASVTRILADASNVTYMPGFVLFRRDNTLMAQPFDPARLQATGGVVPIAEQVSVAGNSGYGAFTLSLDGTVAYRSGLQGGNRQLVWLDRSGKRLSEVSKPDEISDPALSPDGKTVVFGVGNSTAGVADLWLQHLDSGVLSKFTFGPGSNSAAVWSPDASRIAFAANPSPSTYQIQQLGVAGAGRPEVVLQGVPYVSVNLSDWSRDGKRIVFSSRSEKTKDDLWLLPTEGDRKAVPFLQTPANERGGHFSPDGAWLAYQSDESGRYEIYVQHVPPNGSKFQISSAGGAGPRWSGDGKELFYIESGQKLMSVPVKVGTTFERGQGRLLVGDLHLFSLSGGAPYQPSADGQRFLALLQTEGDSQVAPITVVTNWQTSVKK